MITNITTLTLLGLEGHKIEIQIDVSNNLPKWEIVGLPDTSVKESKERVKTAIKNSGFEIRGKKILINLAPAEIKKEGAIFDLGIAVGILVNLEYIKKDKIEEYAFLGELSLDGKVNSINGILANYMEV